MTFVLMKTYFDPVSPLFKTSIFTSSAIYALSFSLM